ncbi:MAG: hypothetical protein D6732_27415 [Methanobacteriota archaeon]|nr:MAG: hypothetical protein D6732_27415 [Euryarchaeota archaeon]
MKRGGRVLILCARHRVENEELIDRMDVKGCSICNPQQLGDAFERLASRWIMRCLTLEKLHGEGRCVPTFEPYDRYIGTDPVP